jgi:phage terminase large subunit
VTDGLRGEDGVLDLSGMDEPDFQDLNLVRDDLSDVAPIVELPFGFKAREYQAPVWDAVFRQGKKRIACPWHRRAGKDRNFFNVVACMAQLRKANYLYVLPTAVQARKVIWDGIGSDGFRYIDHIPASVAKRNSTEMKFEYHCGSILQIAGADRPDSLRGTNPWMVALSEYQHINPTTWNTILQPVLAENGGVAMFNWTPYGKNHAWQMHQLASKDPDWFLLPLDVSQTTRADGTPVVSQEDIDRARAGGMSEAEILQEFWLSYEAPNPGAYYDRVLRQARATKRICFIPIEPTLDCVTFWDLGINDYMAIWVGQFTGRELRWVHYYQNCGEGMAHYVQYLRTFAETHGVRFSGHWAPHDIEVRELSTGKTRRETASKMGINFHVAPRIGRAEGIEAVRAIFPRCFFDEKGCADGLSALSSYTKVWDDKNKVYRDEPLHNWASNGADAFRTFAVAFRESMVAKVFGPGGSKPRRPRMNSGFDPLGGGRR